MPTLKPMPNTVVHCKTKDEYDRLMALYEAAGWRWCSGQPVRAFVWESRGEDNEKRILITVSPSFANVIGTCIYDVLPFPDFLREQGIDQLRPEDLKVGDWIEVVEGF